MHIKEPILTTLLGPNIRGDRKWSTFITGKDGNLYGIPFNAPKVVRFNPINKSVEEIGPDLSGEQHKWNCGVLACGTIYCAPWSSNSRRFHLILKIDTNMTDNNGAVDILRIPVLQEFGDDIDKMWSSGALAFDGNIYFMPANVCYILKLNPHNETLSPIGSNLGKRRWKFSGAVLGADQCIYGLPYNSKQIIKFNPLHPNEIYCLGHEAPEEFWCDKGVMASIDGCIYSANMYGQVLKIDTIGNSYTWKGGKILSIEYGWGDPVIGVDSCIYWPPMRGNRVLKFDPDSQQQLPPIVVGGDLASVGTWGDKFRGGTLAPNGTIYFIPNDGNQILAVDPDMEFSMKLQRNLQMHPKELGRLFEKDEDGHESFYENAVRKFGKKRVFQIIEQCLPSDVEWAQRHGNRTSNIPLFMIAASCASCKVPLLFYILRRDVHTFLLGNVGL